jgi:hypothetical protein
MQLSIVSEKREEIEDMLKRTVVLLMALALVVVGLCTKASAQPGYVGDNSKKGSLLIFPKILTETADNGTVWYDTIITIGNDHSRSVNIECFWVDDSQNTADFMFSITGFQPRWFKASDGLGTGGGVSPFGATGRGELKCWAMGVTPDMVEYQALFNHLYGTATIIDNRNQAAFEYTAYAFKAHYPDTAGVYTTPVGDTGTLVLNTTYPGPYYDTGPGYIAFNFFATGRPGTPFVVNKTDITLIPLRQDLRQDRIPTCTKAKFDVWNENEVKLTGAYQCIKCWFEGSLEKIGTYTDPVSGKPTGYLGSNFSYKSMHTNMGRMRVTSVASSQCKKVFLDPWDGKTDLCADQIYTPGLNLQSRTPLLGVIMSQILLVGDDDKTTIFGTTAAGAGVFVPDLTQAVDETVTIKWDPPSQTLAPKRR